MFYQEKKTIASIISGFLVLAAYIIYGISKYQQAGPNLLNDLKFWAAAMLVAIVGGIVVTILFQIALHIILAAADEVAKEVSNKTKRPAAVDACEELEMENVEDEMDKLIALKAMRNAYAVVGIGFIASLVSLYVEKPPAIMLNIIFISFILGSLFEGFSQLYFYRKGIENG
jgi:uncharacterized membrane protein YjjP (DUF1212 family)